MKDYDAIVIGAGNGGLTAAATLQRGGARTLLLERHNIPGGCATSFVRGDYEFEVALHQLSGLGTKEKPFIMRKIFNDLGVMDKVEFVQEGELYRIVVPGELDITLPASWTGLKNTLKEAFPTEEKNIDDFLKLCEKISMESFMALPRASRMPDDSLIKASCPTFIKYGLRSAKDVLDEIFTDEKIKTVLAAYWCYLGLPPSQIAFSDLAVMIYAYAAFKPWHIKGGSQALSSALLESFLEAGGEVKFNCSVEQILTTSSGSGKPEIRAVSTEHGEEFSCDTVVSNASSVITYNELLDIGETPQAIQEDFKSRRLGTSAFVLYMGLDCTPEELGVKSASNFICSTMDEELMHDTMKTMDAPVATMLTCYNFDDPSFAPEGKSLVALLCLQYGEQWESIPSAKYAETKYALADKLIDQAETVFPNIRKNIEEIEVATPLTMMRYLNTPGGAIYGFQQNPQDSALFRDRINEVSGLFLAGCWNGMGGFQPTYMAGQATAKAALKKLKTKQVSRQSAQTEEVSNV